MDQPILRKPRHHFDKAPHPSHVTFDDGKVLRRNLPWVHFGEARWTYAEPDLITIEIAGWLVSIVGYNLGPLFNAIEEHALLRVKAHPEFATSPDHANDSFATQIRFSKTTTVGFTSKSKRFPELDLGDRDFH